MAEFVQQSLEEMLPELEQMERIGLFTGAETRAIMKKRKGFEYKLRRRTKEKEDFLQYIQYEMNVMALVKKRRERLGYSYKRAEIDISIVQRIHKLFKLAIWRFQNDVKLWLSHIEFAKKRNEKATVGRLYTKMFQVHNRKPDLWIAGAAWEMEVNLSMENARGLLQRALRFNPQSRKLWLEYFRMELLNADKLMRRKEVLGLAGMETEDEDISDAIIDGQIAAVVYKQAVNAIPDNAEFCISFLPVVRLFNFAGKVEDEIFKEVRDQFPNSELTWHAIATRPLHRRLTPVTPGGKKKKLKEEEVRTLESECFAIFEKAVYAVPTEKMWTLYVQTCLERIALKSTRSFNEYRISRALSVCKRACEEGKLSEEMALKWIELLCGTGQVEELASVTQTLVEKSHPCSVSIWTERLRYLAQFGGEDFYPQLELALKNVKDKESLPLWELGLQWCEVSAPDRTETLLQQGTTRCASVSTAVKEYYLEWSMSHQGLSQTGTLYKSLSSSKPLSLHFFQRYIALLNSQPNPKMKRLRKAYEDAISEYGSSHTELWLDYIQLELTHPSGKPENSSTLHWRALKAMDGNLAEKFITEYSLLQNGVSF